MEIYPCGVVAIRTKKEIITKGERGNTDGQFDVK